MIKIILDLLEKLPYRTKFGLSISDILKIKYYAKIGSKKRTQKCLCGGKVYTRGIPPDGWETSCGVCNELYDED